MIGNLIIFVNMLFSANCMIIISQALMTCATLSSLSGELVATGPVTSTGGCH